MLAAKLGWKSWPKSMGPAMVIPYREVSGELNGYASLKPDTPRKRAGSDDRIKYERPKGMPNRVYIPPGTVQHLKNAGVELVITEGEKKAAKVIEQAVVDLLVSRRLQGVGTGLHPTDEVGRMVAAEIKSVAANV